MTRSTIPVLQSLVDSNTPPDMVAGGIELNDLSTVGGYNGEGYRFLNPTAKAQLFLTLDGNSRSQGRLTVVTNPTVNDTFTIGVKVFTIKATAAVNGEVTRGASVAVTQANIAAAINGTDGINTASVVVKTDGFNASNYCILTALVPGTDGDSIVTTETFAAGGNVFDAATLGTESAGGQDSAVTITVRAVPDPLNRGGFGTVPSYNIVYALTAGGIGNRVLPLGTFTPVLYNQDDGMVYVDVTGLTGTGRLAALYNA